MISEIFDARLLTKVSQLVGGDDSHTKIIFESHHVQYLTDVCQKTFFIIVTRLAKNKASHNSKLAKEICLTGVTRVFAASKGTLKPSS